MSNYADRFTALLDACVLCGALRRNLLLSLAEAGFFRAMWSERILDETQKCISRTTRCASNGSRQRIRIENAFPDSLVNVSEILEQNLGLPDPEDDHVLAAAIAAQASVIVTDNLRDFPMRNISPHEIEALSADDFIANTIELSPTETIPILKRMRRRMKRPAFEAKDFVDYAKQQGLVQVAEIMKKYVLNL